MKKICSLVIVFTFALTLLAGCGGGQLPDGMDPAAAEALAKEIVNAMNARDFEQLVALYTGGTAQGIAPPTAQEWEASANQIEEQLQLGDFAEYTQTRFNTVTDDTFGEYGVVILGAKYGKKSIAWRVSIDKDMNIIGLRV